MRLVRHAGPGRKRPLPGTDPASPGNRRGRCACSRPGNGRSCRASPAAGIRRQPPGRRIPSRLDARSCPALPAPVSHRRRDRQRASFARRPDSPARQNPCKRRKSFSRLSPGSLECGPKRVGWRSARRRTQTLPSDPSHSGTRDQQQAAPRPGAAWTVPSGLSGLVGALRVRRPARRRTWYGVIRTRRRHSGPSGPPPPKSVYL